MGSAVVINNIFKIRLFMKNGFFRGFNFNLFSTSDFSRNIINVYNDKNPSNYVDTSFYVNRNLYKHPRDIMSASQYKFLVKVRQYILYERTTDVMFFFGSQFFITWHIIKQPVWVRNLLLVRYLFYWPLPVHYSNYTFNWQTYPSFMDVNITDSLLKIQGYSGLTKKDKARFDFLTRYFTKLWFMFQIGRFYWELPSFKGPTFKMSYLWGEDGNTYYWYILVKQLLRNLLNGILPDKDLLKKEYWRIQDEYQTWIITNMGRYNEMHDYAKLFEGFTPREDDRIVGYQFPTDIGLSLGIYISEYFLVKFQELREYVNRWWHVYRGFYYRFFWRILRLIELGYLSDNRYFLLNINAGLARHLIFINFYFNLRANSLKTGVYYNFYWYFMFNYWSLFFERLLRFSVPSDKLLIGLYSFRPELLVYDREYLFRFYPHIYKFRYIQRDKALAMDVKFYITACEFMEAELVCSISTTQLYLFWHVEIFTLNFDLSEVNGPLDFYEDFYFNFSRSSRNLLYAGSHSMIFLSYKSNDLFGQRCLYKKINSNKLLHDFILNKNFPKVSSLSFYDLYRIILFFFLGIRYLFILRFNKDSLYFSVRQLFFEEFLMFLRFIFFLWWLDRLFILFFKFLSFIPGGFTLYYNFLNFIYWRGYNGLACNNDRWQFIWFWIFYVLNEEEDIDLRFHIYLGKYFGAYYVKGFYELVGLFFCCFDDCTNELSFFHEHDTVEEEYDVEYETEEEEEDSTWEAQFPNPLFMEKEDLEDLPFLRNSGAGDSFEDWGTEDSITAIEASEDYDVYLTKNPYRLVQRGWDRFYIQNVKKSKNLLYSSENI